jgi:predicted nucleotidyltransferase
MQQNRKIQNKLHQNIIANITEIIKETGKEKIAFIILFGSFAKDKWVYDIYRENGALYEYASDYDFLIITKKNSFAFNSKMVQKIKAEITRKHLNRVHPTTIITESLAYVNSQIEKSQYFFLDILKEGKILFDSAKFKLAEPKPLSEEEKLQNAKEDYEYWMNKAANFLDRFQLMVSKEQYSDSAFDLHQATESLYSCTLLTLTGYKPKSHDLEILNTFCATHSKKFLTIFPKPKPKPTKHRLTSKSQIEILYNSENESDWFELLKIAYIEARYNKNYKIKKEQLEYLLEKVKKLRELVREVCL